MPHLIRLGLILSLLVLPLAHANAATLGVEVIFSSSDRISPNLMRCGITALQGAGVEL